MLNTKYMLMFAVLSAGMLTGLTATGMTLGQTAFAHEGKKYDKDQTIDQENHCKIVILNEHGDDNRQNDNNNHLTCQNLAQNAKSDASIDGNPFSGSNYGNPFSGSN